MRSGLLCALVAAVVAGCGGVPVDRYEEYYRERIDSYSFSVERHRISARVSYVPAEVFVARELRAGVDATVAELMERYERSLFFVLTVVGEEYPHGSPLLYGNGTAGYADAVARNHFNRRDDVFVLAGDDTVHAAAYRYDKALGFGNSDAFVFAFPADSVRPMLNDATLMIRNMTIELGTVEVPLKRIVRPTKTIRSRIG